MRSMKNWLAGVLGERTKSRRGTGPRLALEPLEDRTAPAVLTVNSTADTANVTDGCLSLRTKPSPSSAARRCQAA